MHPSRLQRMLALRPGEGRSVAYTVAIAFSVSAGLMIAQSGIEAIFFARKGVDDLPGLYLILGVTMFLLTIGFGAFLARTDRRRASIAVPIVVAALALAGRAGLALDVGWVPQALWLLQGVGYFVLGLAVWGIAGIVTDTRQAKRFFPLIGAGTVLGTVLGGLATKPLASAIGTPNLLFVWVVTLAVAVALATRLLARSADDPAARQERVAGLAAGFRYVRGSALMRWLSLAAVLFSLLFFSLYLPFSRSALERYPEPEDLAGFLGLFFGVATGLSFVLSLFVTNRLLARFGVPVVAMVFPVLYVVAFAALTVDASFVVLAAARFAQVAWMQGGASSAWEAVVNTTPPDRRDQTRAFLYGGPTQAGTFLAGVIALVGERAFSPSLLFGIGLASAVVLTVQMLGVRREYPRELVRALREGRPSVFGSPARGTAVAPDDAASVAVAVEALRDDDVRVRRVAAVVLGDLDTGAVEDALRAALDDPDPEVRAAAIGSLARLDRAGGADIAQAARDADPAVRRAAVEVLASAGDASGGPPQAEGPLAQLLGDDDVAVRASAAAALVRRTGDQGAVEVLDALAGADDPSVRATAFAAVARSGDARLVTLSARGLEDAEPAVRAEAARAFASTTSTTDGRDLAPLLSATADPSRLVRDAAAEALAALGDAAREPLVAALDEPERRDGALAALERLGVDDGLRQAIERRAEASVADAVGRHLLASALAQVDDERLALLQASLRARAERDAREALRAAALLGGGAEMRVALDNLSADDGLQRANALEVIETVAAHGLVRPLLAMWDGSSTTVDAGDVLAHARHDPDAWIRACAELAASPTGGTMQTLTTLSPMERVLFLRKVPLFAELAPPDLLPIATIAEETTFVDGDAIAEQGQPGDVMHVIVSGDVDVIASEPTGRRVLATRSSGDAVGEMALLTSKPRMAGLVARGPVRVLSIDRRNFEAILRERPETSLGVIRVLCQRLAEPVTPDAQPDATGSAERTTPST